MVESSESPVEVNGGLGRADAFLVTPVGQCTVGDSEVCIQPRLKTQIPDLFRYLQAMETCGDRPTWIDLAVQDAKVCIASTHDLQQSCCLGDSPAALDTRHCLVQSAH